MPTPIQLGTNVAIGLSVLSALSLAASIALLPGVLSRLPEDYLLGVDPRPRGRTRGRRMRAQVLGWALVSAGVAMLVLPGQGILTIAAGFVLIEAPWKHRQLRRLLGRRSIRRAVNAIRRRRDVPELTAPEPQTPAPEQIGQPS